MNALFQGDGIYFEGPLPFGRPQIRSKLEATQRLTPPTIGDLAAIGVKAFAWITPREKFKELGDDGGAWEQYAAWDPNPAVFALCRAPLKDHRLRHEGCLLEAGVKYAIRTDVMFVPCEPSDSRESVLR